MRETNESYKASQIESGQVMPMWASIVLCVFFLLDKHMEGKVYGFGVEDVEITKVTEKARITDVAEMAEMTEGV
jgi:hypothetical protein